MEDVATVQEGSQESASSQSPLRGPLILAKMVIDALEKKKKGDGTDYNAIIGHLTAAQMKPVVMKRWLQALAMCVSQLTKEYDLLVGATLRMSWYSKDSDIVQLYIEYLTNLISAQTYYLRSSFQVLVKLLWLPSAEGESVYHNIHLAIQLVLDLVPTAPSVLMPLLRKSYPFKGKSSEIQELAIRNVLHITSYCPTLRDDVLELVIHQMLTIDVEVPQLSEDDGDTELCSGEDTQFHVELESTNGESESCHGVSPSTPSCLSAVFSQRQLMSNDAAEKLDVMMTIASQHLESLCFSDGKLVMDVTVNLFHSLLKIFERVILPTHACSHVQFLLFRLSSLHESLPGGFLDFLWEKFQDPNTPAVLRQTTAAYIASYVARAKFVPLSTAKLCLTITTQWIHQYLDHCRADNMKPDVKQHGPFFYLCQAVFYIFVFRHKQLLEMEGGLSFLRQLNLDRVVSSRLNPLKVCLLSVVETFAALSSRHEIVFCYTILEQNKRLILSTTPVKEGRGADKSTQQTNLLDCFFPFDPYNLKRSSQFIHTLFQDWEEDEQDQEQNEKEENDDESSRASSLQSDSYYGSHSQSMDSHGHSLPNFTTSPF